jgi:thioredoxin-related protein
MENLFLNLGLSYVFSLWLGYLLAAVFGGFISLFFWKKSRQKTWKKWVLAVLLFAAPLLAQSILSPIYESDVKLSKKRISIRNKFTSQLENGILVLAIPGCPYCMESIEDLKLMKRRNPDLKIDFLVLGTEDKSLLKDYFSEAEGQINIKMTSNSALFDSALLESFPTFVIVENREGTMYWDNNSFGAPAKDLIESVLSNN